MGKLSRILAVLTILSIFPAVAEAPGADAIVGNWIDRTKEGVFEIYREGDRYFGRIARLKSEVYPEGDPEAGKRKHDRENPDPALRDREMIGLVFLRDFAFENGKYTGGTIYNPENGKTYKCKMTVNGAKLNVRGYIGISLLGKTEVWTRVQD